MEGVGINVSYLPRGTGIRLPHHLTKDVDVVVYDALELLLMV